MKGFFRPAKAINEPVRSYAPNSADRKGVEQAIAAFKATPANIGMLIGGEVVFTENCKNIVAPHDHNLVLGKYHIGDEQHIQQAIDAALGAKEQWEEMSWEHRASIFLKAAELIAGKYRYQVNAATMLGQSKSIHQAEIDAVCETVDFFRFNVEFMSQLYAVQPESPSGVWNRLNYRPLEGFVLAITPFNFTSIAINLPAAPALMGNTVIWKPSDAQVYSAALMMQILQEAGLPAGVINMIFTDAAQTADIALKHPDFVGLHFTGSTDVFKNLWKKAGENIHLYKNFPRLVGETGGKDFVLAHKSADAEALAVALLRGAFEFQGQKCSAASRAYIPSNLMEAVEKRLKADLATIKMGSPEDFSCFFNAVIHERAFDKIVSYIEQAKASPLNRIIAGGNYDKSKGYFIEPTVIVTQDPMYMTMCEEIFGPVLTIYEYGEEWFEEALILVEQTSPYGLTGAIFAQDRYAIELACKALRNTAGNFYINDKPTGAVVGQQPFGGARYSGTNDKAGAMFNLLRWVSPQTIKETFLPPTDYRYPFLEN